MTALLVLLAALLLWLANRPRCVRGHHEDVTLPGYWHTTGSTFGDMINSTTRWVPERRVKKWVCDEYDK